MTDVKKWISYYKRNLSDSLKADINVSSMPSFEEKKFDINDFFLKNTDRLNSFFDHEEEKINRSLGITKKDSEEWQTIHEINVMIAPFYLYKKIDPLVPPKPWDRIYPFWYLATVNRDAKLGIPEQTFPHFQRRFLEPFADDKKSFVFSSMDAIDNLAGIRLFEDSTYDDYLEHIGKIFKEATRYSIHSYETSEYSRHNIATVVLPDEKIGASIYIIDLYNKLEKRNKTKDLHLLKKLLNLNHPSIKKEPVKVNEFPDYDSKHLGQMGDEFPLSYSQRVAMLSFLNKNETVFAINGPPGTGKTVMIQNILATKVVESAIQGEDPYIILACSNNNQAVTNIIDSFKKNIGSETHLSGRWIPDFRGYGTYLVSSTVPDAVISKYNYEKARPSSPGTISSLESSEYINTAEEVYLKKFGIYSGLDPQYLTINHCTEKLRAEIIEIRNSIELMPIKYRHFSEAVKLLRQYCSTADLNSYYLDNYINIFQLDQDRELFQKLEQKVIQYFKGESFWRKFLCFFNLKAGLESRHLELKRILRGSEFEEQIHLKMKKNDPLRVIGNKISLNNKIIDLNSKWENYKKRIGVKGNPPVDDSSYIEYEQRKNQNPKSSSIKGNLFDELDLSLRNKMFYLAIHYWEGRWINAVRNIGKNNLGESATRKRWKRYAMLTPCFVSTFYMAPRFFSYSKFIGENDIGDAMWGDGSLYNFIDLIIVDEAGQVAPEVGVATFSLGKRALVTGDIKQIEPIWNINKFIDLGNLNKANLIRDYQDKIYDEVYEPKGVLSSSGSIMKMAQTATDIKDQKININGVHLLEHRRCYNEIIDYCNQLAYEGQLLPMRGRAPKESILPPLAYIHVNGKSSTLSNTNRSRQNKEEVEAIVFWLIQNKARLESYYEKRIEDIAGIITPFTAQKHLLRQALKGAKVDTYRMKIGTVHALQGAERELIILSLVYGPNEVSTMFFDRGPNMLNVAVSRAKNHLIVFANREIFSPDSNTPSSRLFKFLH